VGGLTTAEIGNAFLVPEATMAQAARAEDTDWSQILALYDLLKRMSDNPMVMLNHAIAAAMVPLRERRTS